jgi:molybdate transport system substrate-binding protein
VFKHARRLKAHCCRCEAADLVILSAAGTDELIKQGKIDPSSRADFAKAAVAVAVRAGAPTPDISSGSFLATAYREVAAASWCPLPKKKGASARGTRGA